MYIRGDFRPLCRIQNFFTNFVCFDVTSRADIDCARLTLCQAR